MTSPRSGLISIWREREHARRDFYAFCEFVLLRSLPNRKAAPFHVVLCERTQSFVLSPDDAILLVNLPPAAAKTLFISRLLPAWLLGTIPCMRVACVANKLDLSEQNGRAIRDIITSPGYQLLFPDVKISPTSSAAAEFETTAGGSFVGLGIDGKIMGRRVSTLILDDVVGGYEQAASASQLEAIYSKYEMNLRSRMNPGGKIINIQQRLATRDITGRIIEEWQRDKSGRRVETFILPLECTDPEADPLGRALGENLWPAFYTSAMVADYRKNDFIWRTMAQQEPPAESGTWVAPEEVLNLPMPRTLGNDSFVHYIAADLAYSINRGDATVFLTIAYDKTTRIAHIVDCFRGQVDPDVSSRKLLSMVQLWSPTEVLVDDDTQSKLYGRSLGDAARQHGIAVPWKTLPLAGRDKEMRAGPVRGMFKAGRISIDRSQSWAHSILQEIFLFPNGGDALGVDDAVDALTSVRPPDAGPARRRTGHTEGTNRSARQLLHGLPQRTA